MTTRAEHIAWAKQRALEYVERGALNDAVKSMTSDLNKHPETWCPLRDARKGIEAVISGNPARVRGWIEGFK